MTQTSKYSPVFVLGDLMLDISYTGKKSKISPEGPFPVILIDDIKSSLGGAANVAANIASLGGKVELFGIVGRDSNYETVLQLCEQFKIGINVEFSSHVTITKNRVYGNNQQCIRFDLEEFFLKSESSKLFDVFKKNLQSNSIVVISDYGKGTISSLKEVIGFCKSKDCFVIVDSKNSNIEEYQGADILTPNLLEFSKLFPEKKIDRIDTLFESRLQKLGIGNLLITMSEKGMCLVNKDKVKTFPTKAKNVVDVSGAGDTVVATLANFINQGSSLDAAILKANIAAGIVVSKSGTSIVYKNEIETDQSKIYRDSQLNEFFATLNSIRNNRKIVFTNGCFDVFHLGHLKYLKRCKDYGDLLIVALNSDESIKSLKGPDRPINSFENRSSFLNELDFIDFIIEFCESTPLKLIRDLKPDFLIKGGDYNRSEIIGSQYAGETTTIPFEDGFSSTEIINKIKNL